MNGAPPTTYAVADTTHEPSEVACDGASPRFGTDGPGPLPGPSVARFTVALRRNTHGHYKDPRRSRDRAPGRHSVAGAAGTVAGAAGDLTARIPEFAEGTREALTEANRIVQGESDQTLQLVASGAAGFALGLLVGGANRLLVLLALAPAAVIGMTLAQRSGTDPKPSSTRLQGR